jgi:hypothetical protein
MACYRSRLCHGQGTSCWLRDRWRDIVSSIHFLCFGSPSEPLYSGPSPYVPNQQRSLGWVAAKYVHCIPGDPYCYVEMPPYVAGINVRQWPNGPIELSLVNGTPLIVFTTNGDGLNASAYYVGVAENCPLIPTSLWSDTAGVPLLGCGP